jgi:cell division protein FtsB
MRDIGSRIQRYRLSRYADPDTSGRRRLKRWLLPLVGLWVLYAGVLSEHSLWRLWRLERSQAEADRQLQALRTEEDRVHRQLEDPAERRELQEKVLRERNGYARPGEIVYRIEGGRADSVRVERGPASR